MSDDAQTHQGLVADVTIDGKWHRFVATYDEKLRLYIDGEEVAVPPGAEAAPVSVERTAGGMLVEQDSIIDVPFPYAPPAAVFGYKLIDPTVIIEGDSVPRTKDQQAFHYTLMEPALKAVRDAYRKEAKVSDEDPCRHCGHRRGNHRGGECWPDHGGRCGCELFEVPTDEDRAQQRMYQAAPEMLALLRGLEWISGPGDDREWCPECTFYKPRHEEGCALAALLDRIDTPA